MLPARPLTALTRPAWSIAIMPALMVPRNSARGWIAKIMCEPICCTNKPFSMCVAAIFTSARVWRWRDTQSEEASSMPTSSPAGPRTGAAVQQTWP